MTERNQNLPDILMPYCPGGYSFSGINDTEYLEKLIDK